MENFNLYDAKTQFIEAIHLVGLNPPDFVEAGRLYRFPGQGKPRSNKAAWCLLFDDGRGGCFGDWSSGFSDYWQAQRNTPYSMAERAAFARRVSLAKTQAETERKTRQADASDRAAAIWFAATPAHCNYPYLILKRIQSHSARLYKGALILKILDFTGRLTSLQFISPTGEKRLFAGGKKQGCFILVAGALNSNTPLLITEGFSTAASVSKNNPNACVISAIDCENLRSVTVDARMKWLGREITIYGDDDRASPTNVGRTKAIQAGKVAHCEVRFPDFPEDAPASLSDFNDLDCWLTRSSVSG